MECVISALHFVWSDVEDCLRRVTDEFGLDGVEWSWHQAQQRPHCTAQDVSDIRSSGGAGTLSFSAHIWENLPGLSREEGARVLSDWLQLSRVTGVRDIVVHGGRHADQRKGIAHVRSIFSDVLPAYEEAGVVLCLENHYAYTYRDCQELFSEVWEFEEVFSLDSPSLGLCFDTGHGHMTKNGCELVRKLGERLRYVHLADCHGVDDDHCMFREGTVPWDALWEALEDVSFDGTFCVEFPVREDTKPFRRCVQEIRRRWCR